MFQPIWHAAKVPADEDKQVASLAAAGANQVATTMGDSLRQLKGFCPLPRSFLPVNAQEAAMSGAP